MGVREKYDYPKVSGAYQSAIDERSEWETEWRSISDFLLPGRGVYSTYAKPRKRKLTSPKVVNNTAEDALYVLTSGMHGGLTSPSRPWFSLDWADTILNSIEPLKMWLEECQEILHTELHKSNFYSIINSFYIEYAGFGTGCMYVGGDTDDNDVDLRFELLTVGEYAYTYGANGKPNGFYRTIFMSPRQVVERFPKTASGDLKKMVEDNTAGADVVDIVIIEAVYIDEFQDKPIIRLIYEVSGSGTRAGDVRDNSKEPLEVSGFYEWPYPVGRWGTIGSDIYGIGPGSRALPDIKRLQEMEKAFLMATHKAINPPLNAPARMRGKLNTLPGGYNYYANPNETVNEIYQIRFDYQGVGAATERVENRIQKNFFNDIFLTGSRDPNASPLRTGQVQVQEQEKMLRMGPVIERLQHEFFTPVVERCFNICLRKGSFPELPPEYADMVGEYNISLTSPMATAQRAAALQGINSFMGFIGNAAQFDQSILDNVDADKAAREYGDITGVRLGILRPEEDVQQIRAQRAKAQQAEKAKQDRMIAAQAGSQMNAEQATAQKTQAEAGQTQLESQQTMQELGML